MMVLAEVDDVINNIPKLKATNKYMSTVHTLAKHTDIDRALATVNTDSKATHVCTWRCQRQSCWRRSCQGHRRDVCTCTMMSGVKADRLI